MSLRIPDAPAPAAVRGAGAEALVGRATMRCRWRAGKSARSELSLR